MKTIATAAVLMMLAAPAWADEAEKQTIDPANSNEPIVLSEAEMDGVTAGYEHGDIRYPFVLGTVWTTSKSSSSNVTTTGTSNQFVMDDAGG